MTTLKRLVPAVLASLTLALAACDQSGPAEPAATDSGEATPSAAPPPASTAPADDSTGDASTGEAPGREAPGESLALTTTPPVETPATKPPAKTPPKVAAKPMPSTADVSPVKPVTARPVATGVAAVVVEPTSLELGEIPTNDAAMGTVTLVNTGDTPRRIIDCKTSCGCTTANCQKGKVLEPGEKMEVEIKLSGGSRPVKLSKTVTFLVSDQSPIRLAVSGEAVSYVIATPEKLDPAEHPEGRLVLTSVDGEPFTIKSMYPPLIEGFSEEPSAEQIVNVPWDALKESGHRSPKLLFTLDHPKCSKVNATVSVSALAKPTRTATTQRPRAAGRMDLDAMLKSDQSAEVLAALDEGKIKVGEADNSGQTPLVKAARWGNVEVIQALLDASADISEGDRIGRTPLMYAAQSKNVEAVQILLDAGANLAQRDDIGNTALCWAAGFGDAATVKELIEAGAEVEVSGPLMGFTPLIWASLSGEPESIRLLLAAGANVEAADVLQGATPLMHATRTGGVPNVKIILEAGANLEAKEKDGLTALLIAASNAGATAEMVQMLIDAGADLEARSANGRNALELAEQRTDLRSAEVITLLKGVYGVEDGE